MANFADRMMGAAHDDGARGYPGGDAAGIALGADPATPATELALEIEFWDTACTLRAYYYKPYDFNAQNLPLHSYEEWYGPTGVRVGHKTATMTYAANGVRLTKVGPYVAG